MKLRSQPRHVKCAPRTKIEPTWNEITQRILSQQPKSGGAIQKTINEAITQVGRFLAYGCIRDPHSTEDVRDVHSDYCQWTGRNNELWLGERAFTTVIGQYGIMRDGEVYHGLRLITMASAMRARWRENESMKERDDEAEAGRAVHLREVSKRNTCNQSTKDGRK